MPHTEKFLNKVTFSIPRCHIKTYNRSYINSFGIRFQDECHVKKFWARIRNIGNVSSVVEFQWWQDFWTKILLFRTHHPGPPGKICGSKIEVRFFLQKWSAKLILFFLWKKKSKKFRQFLTNRNSLYSQHKMISFEYYVDSCPKILLFRTQHFWNSTTELTLN